MLVDETEFFNWAAKTYPELESDYLTDRGYRDYKSIIDGVVLMDGYNFQKLKDEAKEYDEHCANIKNGRRAL